jgi:hypothetical protein
MGHAQSRSESGTTTWLWPDVLRNQDTSVSQAKQGEPQEGFSLNLVANTDCIELGEYG